MFESIIKSMLPEDFDINAYIEHGKQAFNAAIATAQGVQRIEQKLDAEIVTLRERVAALESVDQTNGGGNDNSNGGTGSNAGIDGHA